VWNRKQVEVALERLAKDRNLQMHPQVERVLEVEASTSRYDTHSVEADSHPIFKISNHTSEEDVGEQRDFDIQSSVNCQIAEINVAFQLWRISTLDTGNISRIEICTYDQSDPEDVELDVKVITLVGFTSKHRTPSNREDVDPIHRFIVMGGKPGIQA